MLHTFVALVEDKPGVLTRVASLFRRLNINIVSLTVGRSERVGVSRMTIVCDASPTAGHRIAASLYKLENVLEIDDVGQLSHVARELALIKVAATPKTRSMVFELVEVFRARIVDLAPESLMIEITGVESKIEGLIQVLNENGDRILEISRTGRMVMRRGQHTSKVLEAMRVPGLETPDEVKAEEESSASDVLMAEETGLRD
jgi:acetolactate synthase-1/3 small subunit